MERRLRGNRSELQMLTRLNQRGRADGMLKNETDLQRGFVKRGSTEDLQGAIDAFFFFAAKWPFSWSVPMALG